MKVWEALAQKHRVVTIGPDDTVAAAIRKLVEGKIRGLPVVDGTKVVGIVTVRDILREVDAHGAAALERPLSGLMTRQPVAANRDQPLEEVEQIFVDRDISHIPVLEEGKLMGVLTPADVFASHLHDTTWLNEHLHAYVQGRVR